MVSVQDITAGYGSVTVIKNISLEVDRGEWVAVIGGNGAGKSTLFRVISGLVRPRSGKIYFEGRELTALPPHEIVNKGIIQVPEGRMLFPKMNVIDNLLLGGRNRRARNNVNESLKKVYDLFPILEKRASQEAGTLSGGEQQMLATARGLMALPRVLLLDEPSLGLAPLMVREIFNSLQILNKEGMTILMVEQNVVVSLKNAERAYVLENGEIVMSGSSKDLINDDRTKQAYLGI
ncbi:MAG: ABC transporter ATP-binding protein [Deltaproteobacteria bacterium]|nr:ABC transporter ATP-binding protein [Deltaproteobacteria bacterium]MBW1923679.1 ABC transporter ATP-binding protein [Deltaproteobacteria bacterium]MBW1950742.1 ABC transporter ATP-binding protein [Deltaproteobacteria bacterium]MBW2008377.1 ABC transporter ATP-binding protein [Deltaproteobacteria bacterium]MBW2348433.1 ABC transporter ATP-binding protein [Deltaproteobacteria bacterium]